MENNLIIKQFDNAQVKIILDENNNPLFELYSAGMALGQVKNAKDKQYPRKERIDENVKNAEIEPVVHNGQQYLTESQLYDLMLEVKTDKVKPFRKWVTSEVLPTIRKTGGYINNSDLMVNTYFNTLDESHKMIIKGLFTEIENKQKQISIMQPKAEYFDALVERNLLTGIRDTAKELKIGQKEFVEFLIENKYVFRDRNDSLKPYMDYVPSLFQIKDWQRDGKSGIQTMITPKGKETFRLLIGKKDMN